MLSLPAPPALFVGRAGELDRVARATAELRLCVVYGVAGVGKSAFLLRAARAIVERERARLVQIACEPGESATTAAGRALAQLGASRTRDPLAALAAEAARQPIVLVLDDLHQADASLLDAAVHLAARRLPLWILGGAREALPLSPVAVDHVVVRLAPLEPDEAAALWARLHELYGPPVPPIALADVLARGASTPLAIKQAFAGPQAPAPADPLGLGELADDEAALLAQVCAFRRPAPMMMLESALGPKARAAAARLAARFLVDWTPEDALAVHDLVREAVARSSRAPGPAEHERCLEWWQQSRAPDLELELLHHAIAIGRDALAIDILSREAGRIARVPPGAAVAERRMAEVIDVLAGRTELPAPVRALRARIRARQGEPARAMAELAAVADEQPLTDLDRGAIAVALGRTDEGIHLLERVLVREALGPLPRILALGSLAGAWRQKGDLERARDVVEHNANLLALAGPVGTALRAFMEGLLLYEAERYAAAAEVLAGARGAIEAAPIPLSLPVLGSLERAVDAARGAPPSEAADSADELFDEGPFFRYSARLFRAEELWRRGDARQAVALADEVVSAAERLGYLALAAGGQLVLGEALAVLGRGDEVAPRLLAALEVARTAAPRLVPRLWVALARIGRAPDPPPKVSDAPGTQARLWALTHRPPKSAEGFDDADARLIRVEHMLAEGKLEPARRDADAIATQAHAAGWRWLHCRARLALAEIALRRGQLDAAEVDASLAEAEVRGYTDERRWADLLRAARARMDDPHATVPADARSERLGLDERPDLVAREAVGARHLSRSQLAEWDLSRFALVVDVAARRVRIGKRTIDLLRRAALMDALCALAARPGELVSTEDLVRAVWHVDYHPLRHHSRITMAMSRLRKLVGAGVVEGTPAGYRLVATGAWLVVEPMAKR